MPCSTRKKPDKQAAPALHQLAKAAEMGNRMLSVLTVLVVALGGLYCVYCLWDDWRQAQSGLPQAMARFKPQQENGQSFEQLLAQNPDVIGWITIDQTHIDQPVVQGRDDMEYINKGADGSYTLAGAIFLSILDTPDFSSAYNILYGHHMNNGGMFGDVTKYLDEDFFQAHQSGKLITRDKEVYALDVFAVLETEGSNPQVYSLHLAADGKTTLLIDYLQDNARYFRLPDESSPKIFALSTCNDAASDARTVVFAWARMEDGQDA